MYAKEALSKAIGHKKTRLGAGGRFHIAPLGSAGSMQLKPASFQFEYFPG